MILRRPRPSIHSEAAVVEHVAAALRHAGARSFLDAGCAEGKYALRLRAGDPGLVFWALDAHAPSLNQVIASRKFLGPMPQVLLDVPEKSVDAVICLDAIEHMTKTDGLLALASFQRVARKLVVVFTPSGFMPQAAAPDNPWQEHLSGWTVEELDAAGWDAEVWEGFDYGEGKFADALWATKAIP